MAKSLISETAKEVISNARNSGQSEYAYVAEFLEDLVHNHEYSGEPPSNLFGTIDNLLISNIEYFVECAKGVLEDLKLIWVHTVNLESDKLDLYLQLKVYHDPHTDDVWFEWNGSRAGRLQSKIDVHVLSLSMVGYENRQHFRGRKADFRFLVDKFNYTIATWKSITSIEPGDKSFIPFDADLGKIITQARQPAEE